MNQYLISDKTKAKCFLHFSARFASASDKNVDKCEI